MASALGVLIPYVPGMPYLLGRESCLLLPMKDDKFFALWRLCSTPSSTSRANEKCGKKAGRKREEVAISQGKKMTMKL